MLSDLIRSSSFGVSQTIEVEWANGVKKGVMHPRKSAAEKGINERAREGDSE